MQEVRGIHLKSPLKMIGIILPTRGLVFTEVEAAIESFREDFEIKVYRSWDLPIPDGHNQLTKKALEDGCSTIWFIEEDTVPTARAVEKLQRCSEGIACIDYAVSGWSCVTKDQTDEILWCGLGCTMVKREVFEKMEYPYFRTDQILRLNDWTWQKLPDWYQKNKAYGTLDIYFCCKAKELGFKIEQFEGECRHLELKSLGQRGTNHGLHQIEPKERITKNQLVRR